MSKIDDPRIALFAQLDQTRDVIYKAVELELAQYQITSVQVKILDMLARHNGGMTFNQLSRATLRELNSISTLIDRMEINGLVKKLKKPRDVKKYVVLTEKGKDKYENIVTERSICLIFDALLDAEKKQLSLVLTKLQVKARDLLGLDYKPPFLTKE
jgi:DNA-binding MarR family transcriptional regulator